MIRFLLSAAAVLAVVASSSLAAEKESRLFELRIYTAAPGKLDALNARFRDHTVKLFEKHGMANVGYWVPIDNAENKLYYVIAHKDMDARKKSFADFGADPDWKKAQSESEKDGKIVAKVESVFLTTTDYSPEVSKKGDGERVFELRIYTATPNNLGNLNDRFRNHTIKLFEKYGMTNLWYYNVTKGQKNDDKMLYYFLAHKSADAHNKSFDEFRKDPTWIAARDASEKKGGGSLTEKEGGVKSIMLKATDYSPIK